MNTWIYAVILLTLHCHPATLLNGSTNIDYHDPSELGIQLKDLTLSTYFSLGNGTKASSPVKDTYIANAEEGARRFFEWFPLKHWGTEVDHAHACYYIQTTYRNAMKDLRRYYWRRTLYKSTLEYEVGYLTHEIIWKYRIVLELHQYLVKWYEGYPARNFAPTVLVLYMYTNVVQHSKAIINLCNMLHEIERKYRVPHDYGVFDDYTLKTAQGSSKGNKIKPNRTIIDEHQAAYDAYLQRLKKEAQRKRREEKERRKQVLNLGKTTTRGKATAKSHWPLHYGWSIEDW